MKFKRKTTIIEAFQYGVDLEPPWFLSEIGKSIRFVPTNKRPVAYSINKNFPSDVLIMTLEGEMRANYYDYIIKGTHGEIYPCKEHIFLHLYEPIDE